MCRLCFVWQKISINLNMRDRSGRLGRITTHWGCLYLLISHIHFYNIPIGYQRSTFCHCGIRRFTYSHCEHILSLYATYCHCNTYMNKLPLSVKKVTRIDTHTHHHISQKVIYTYTHTFIWTKQNLQQQVTLIKVAGSNLCC